MGIDSEYSHDGYIIFGLVSKDSPVHYVLHFISQVLLLYDMRHLQFLLQSFYFVLHRLSVCSLRVLLDLHGLNGLREGDVEP